MTFLLVVTPPSIYQYIVAGVAWVFWRVKDWASDLLPLEIASAETMGNITRLYSTEDIGTVAFMCVSLYFTRLELFAVNTNICGWRERVVFCWCSMICLSSFTLKSRLGTNQNNSREMSTIHWQILLEWSSLWHATTLLFWGFLQRKQTITRFQDG